MRWWDEMKNFSGNIIGIKKHKTMWLENIIEDLYSTVNRIWIMIIFYFYYYIPIGAFHFL